MGDNAITEQRKKPIQKWHQLSIAVNHNVLHMKLMFLFLGIMCLLYPGIMSKCGMLEQSRSSCRASNVSGLYQVNLL